MGSATRRVVCLHGLGRSPSDWDGVRGGLGSFGEVVALCLARERPRPPAALVLTDCFFPPARNGRSTLATLRDYGAHRVAYVRGLRGRSGAPLEPSARAGGLSALGALNRLGLHRGEFDAAAGAVEAPVLVVHARDERQDARKRVADS